MADSASSFILKERETFTSRIASSGGAWLFPIALLLFFAALAAAGGLFFYQHALTVSTQQWNDQIAAQEADLRPELLAQLTDLSTSLSVARSLLQSHVFASNALLLLQAVTHPSVRFLTFNFNSDSSKLEVSGEARSFQTVAEEVRLVEAHPQVTRVEFGGLSRSASAGPVNFRMTIIFKPTLLLLRSQ